MDRASDMPSATLATDPVPRGTEPMDVPAAPYREAFGELPFALSIFDCGSGEICAVNRAFEASTGLAAAEVVGRDIQEVGLFARPDEYRTVVAELRRGRPVDGFELTSRLADGREITGYACAAPIRFEGRAAAVLAAPDVTDRLTTERELERSRAFFAGSFFSGAAPNILTRYSDGMIVEVNDALCRHFNCERGDLIGKTVVEAGFFSEERRAQVVAELSSCPPGAVIRDEMLSPEGNRIVAQRSSAVIEIDGEKYIMTTGHDVTDSERLRELMERVEALGKIGGFEGDLATGRISLTRETCRMYGLEEDAELTLDEMETLVDRLHAPESARRLRAAQKRLFEEGHPYDLELEVRRGDGSTLWFRKIVEPRWSDERVVGFSGVIHEITAEKNAAEERRQYEVKLRRLALERLQAERRERERIAALLHDTIIQDLAVLKLDIGLYRQRPEAFESQLDTLLERSSAIIQRGRELLYEIAPPLLHDLGLRPALEAVGERFAAEHGVEFQCDCRADDAALTRESRNLLYQSVQELLTNVQKHASARRVTVRTAMSTDGTRYVLEVEDDGAGMPSERPAAPEAETGFGLFGIRNRMESVGGRLELEDASDGGLIARLVMPLKFAAEAGRT